jgi:hypothetical protein
MAGAMAQTYQTGIISHFLQDAIGGILLGGTLSAVKIKKSGACATPPFFKGRELFLLEEEAGREHGGAKEPQSCRVCLRGRYFTRLTGALVFFLF